MGTWIKAVRVAAAVASLACGHRHPPSSGAGRAATTAGGPAPRISAVSPDTAVFGMAVTITIKGAGFAPDSNRVVIGPVRVERAPSDREGTTLQVTVPATLPSAGEVAPLRLTPGTYAVTVSTRFGTSNAVPFTLVWR
jgi:IPT/TIG domain-containing protein